MSMTNFIVPCFIFRKRAAESYGGTNDHTRVQENTRIHICLGQQETFSGKLLSIVNLHAG